MTSISNAEGGASVRTKLNNILSTVFNVKDFGAIGDSTNGSNGTDDTAAIQAAVDWTANANRGVIFFPPGGYKTTAPITFNSDNELSIIFEGVGNLSTIYGNYNGYILDRSGTEITSGIRVVRNLKLVNAHATGGGVRLGHTVGGGVENCHISAYRAIVCGLGNSWHCLNCKLTSSTASGSVGILGGNGLTIMNCDIQAFEHGIRHSNVGLQVIGGRIEVCTVGILLGQDDAGATSQSSAAIIAGVSMEANQTHIDLHAATRFDIDAVSGGGGVSLVRGIYAHGASDGSIRNSNFSCSAGYTTAAVDADCNGSVLFDAVNGTTTAGAASWLLPSDHPSKLRMIRCNVEQTCLVSQLPTAAASWAGQQFVVTDANSTTHSPTTAVVGSGSNIVPVLCRNDASTWKWIIQ